MNWLNTEIAQRWRTEGKRYASEINEYVRIGMENGWPEELQPLRMISAEALPGIFFA